MSFIVASSYLPSLHTKASSRARISSNSSRIGNQILFWTKQGKIVRDHDKSRRSFVVYSVVLPEAPQPPSHDAHSNFLNWLAGVVFTMVLPFFTHKWGPLLKIKNEVDTAVATIEVIVDAVEKVAEKVEEAAEHMAEELPEGGRLRKAVDFVENVAETTAKDAHIVGDLIDKVQEAEEKVEACVEEVIVHQHPEQEDRARHHTSQLNNN